MSILAYCLGLAGLGAALCAARAGADDLAQWLVPMRNHRASLATFSRTLQVTRGGCESVSMSLFGRRG